MAQPESHVVELQNDFYRDGFSKVILIMASICIGIVLLVALSVYIHLNKPPPITFRVGEEWRILPEVPLDQPYLNTADLLQWVSNVLPKAFVYDFNHYNSQLEAATQYFTSDGWKVFLDQLNNYANYNNVQAYKLFINGTPASAPYVVNQGLLTGRYAWWVEMPININYAGFNPPANKTLTLQVLVVRVSTLNNLNGVGIDNVIVAKEAGS